MLSMLGRRMMENVGCMALERMPPLLSSKKKNCLPSLLGIIESRDNSLVFSIPCSKFPSSFCPTSPQTSGGGGRPRKDG
jgi:hypothetical protein